MAPPKMTRAGIDEPTAARTRGSAEKRSLPPPRPESKSDYECKYCEYMEICHASPVWDNPKLNEIRLKFYPFDNL